VDFPARLLAGSASRRTGVLFGFVGNPSARIGDRHPVRTAAFISSRRFQCAATKVAEPPNWRYWRPSGRRSGLEATPGIDGLPRHRQPSAERSHGRQDSARRSARVRFAKPTHSGDDHANCSRPSRGADRYPNGSSRNLRFFGTEPVDLADHVPVAWGRGEDVEAFRSGRGCRRLFRTVRSAQGESASADRAELPDIVIQEAGLDGFWIHRVLQSEGIESHVVDAASILTSRRRRRAKTDRIDGETLVRSREGLEAPDLMHTNARIGAPDQSRTAPLSFNRQYCLGDCLVVVSAPVSET
jgi:hypothetical protein